MNRLFIKVFRVRFLFRIHMVCPLGLHRYRATYLHLMIGHQPDGVSCVFCGHRRAVRQAS